MFTFGFYNSKNGDRKYNATHFSKIFDGVIKDGVFGAMPSPYNSKFKVTPLATPGLSAIVNPGKAWLMHTWNLLDSQYIVSFNSVPDLLKRTDAICIEVNDNYTAGDRADRTNKIVIVEGNTTDYNTQTIVKPSLTQIWNSIQTERRIWQYPIAYVTIYGHDKNINGVQIKANEISAACIENVVGISDGTEANKYITWTPLVTGATMGMDVADYFPDYDALFDEYLEQEQAKFNDWYKLVTKSLIGDFIEKFPSEPFIPNIAYYEKSGDYYVITQDPTPQEGKTYYYYYTGNSIGQIETKIDTKIIYGTQPPVTLEENQVYFQIEE